MKTLNAAGILIFGILGIVTAIGATKNSTQIAVAVMCFITVAVFCYDLKKESK